MKHLREKYRTALPALLLPAPALRRPDGRQLLAGLLALLLASAPGAPAHAAALGETEIIAAASSTDCLDYRLDALCVWLQCGPLGCTTQLSPRVRHYLPDAVVTAHTASSPWPYAATLARSAASLFGQQEGGGPSRVAAREGFLRFKNVEIIGSPGLAAIQLAAGSGFLCPSAAQPYTPYFLSDADTVGWRLGIPETLHPEAVLPGQRLIGGLGNIWGTVRPRQGFLIQADDFKAAAVAAQRAADITTRRGQSHLYRHLGGACGRGCWGPEALRENAPETGKWQLLLPRREQHCAAFGAAGQSSTGRGTPEEQHAWHLWRPYTCCQPRGQLLLTVLPLEHR